MGYPPVPVAPPTINTNSYSMSSVPIAPTASTAPSGLTASGPANDTNSISSMCGVSTPAAPAADVNVNRSGPGSEDQALLFPGTRSSRGLSEVRGV